MNALFIIAAIVVILYCAWPVVILFFWLVAWIGLMIIGIICWPFIKLYDLWRK